MRNPCHVIGLAILIGVTGCKYLHDPVICNGYNEPIRVVLSLSSGRHSELALGPGEMVYAGIKKAEVSTSISVLSAHGRELASYSGSDMQGMRADAQAAGDAWLLTTNGIFHIKQDELRNWQQRIQAIEQRSRDR